MELFGFNLEELVYWHWWVVAAAFLIIEMLTMSFFFLWLGASAVIVGVLLLLMPDLAWQYQVVIWGALSAADLIGWRIYKKNSTITEIKSDEPMLNKRGDQYVGRTFTLEEDIVNGFGKVKVDDSIWKVESDMDIKAGSKIKVVSLEGTVLQIKNVE